MEFTIKGQRFVPASSLTLGRVVWIGKWGRKAGWSRLDQLPSPETPAAVEDLLHDLTDRAFEADAVLPLLAGGFERTGEPWTEAQAMENMACFPEWQDPPVLDALVEILTGFLMRAPALWSAICRCSSLPSSGDGDVGPRRPDSSSPLTQVMASGTTSHG
jgi:hypothetical protein